MNPCRNRRDLPLQSVGIEATLVPHPHQIEACDRILAARGAGRGGFLLGDCTGLGKTLAAWLTIASMPDEDVLIICPRGAIPALAADDRALGLPAKNVTVINYERTNRYSHRRRPARRVRRARKTVTSPATEARSTPMGS